MNEEGGVVGSDKAEAEALLSHRLRGIKCLGWWDTSSI